VIGFGAHPKAAVRLLDCVHSPRSSTVEAALTGTVMHFALPVPGRHWVMNSLAVLAAASAAGADPRRAAAALAELHELPGRGQCFKLPWQNGTITLIDESYNASPSAVGAALAVLAATPPDHGGRRVVVLGDMLELGAASERLHRELAEPLAAAKVDRVFLVGTAVAALHDALPEARRGGLRPTADAILPELLCSLRAGDVVTVKGSRGIGLGRLVERLRAESARPET